MKESTYNRALKMIRSMSWADRAAIFEEQAIDFRYSPTGQIVLAHQIGDEGEAWEMLDAVRGNYREGRTAHDEYNARPMSLGEIMREAARRVA